MAGHESKLPAQGAGAKVALKLETKLSRWAASLGLTAFCVPVHLCNEANVTIGLRLGSLEGPKMGRFRDCSSTQGRNR